MLALLASSGDLFVTRRHFTSPTISIFTHTVQKKEPILGNGSIFLGDAFPKQSVSFAGNAKSLTRHIVTFATVAQRGSKQNEPRRKHSLQATKGALHTPPLLLSIYNWIVGLGLEVLHKFGKNKPTNLIGPKP